MKMWRLLLWVALGACLSGCMTHTPRVLPADHGLTPETALANVRSVLGRSSATGLTPKATPAQFQYWNWEAKQMVGSFGNTITYAVPLKSARYTDITNVVVETFIWISPGSPFLMSAVWIHMRDGHHWKVQPQAKMSDVCMMLPPFWFFSPRWSVHRANELADSFLFMRELQSKSSGGTEPLNDRDAFEDAIKKSMSSGGLSSDEITITYPDGTKKTISNTAK